MKYKHLFFDLDHTLWDGHNSSAESIVALYNTYNMKQYNIVSADDFVTAFHEINYQLWDDLENHRITRNEVIDTRFKLLLAKFDLENDNMAANLAIDYHKTQKTQLVYMPNTRNVLSYLKSKYTLHIFTNSPNPQSVERKIVDIKHYFTEIIGSYSSGYSKPHTISFETALEKAGAEIHHSLMIGDSQSTDIIGAVNMGMDCVWLNQRKQVVLAQPTYEISSLSELMQLL